MNGDKPEEKTPAGLSSKYVEEAVFFVVNWHAATVNMRLYPPTSSMVTETVDKARSHLDSMLEQSDQFSVSVLENNLLINDVRLDELEQQKAPVRSFVQWMNERGLTSLEFKPGVTPEEVSTVFEVLSAPPDHRVNLSEVLVERGVENVTLNQRVYVAITSGEEADGIRKASPLDALKDELLMRYLMGKVNLGDVQDKELVEVLSDSGKVGGLLSTFIREEGSEGGILVRSQKAEEALARLSEMVDQVEDEQLRAILSEQIGGIISEMTPREMTSVLTGEAPETVNLAHLRERVLTMLGDKELLEMVDSLISDYMDMKSESDELEVDWQREKLRSLNELLIEMREERGEELAEVVDQKLEAAGIVEERDPSTGRRVLSAYQLLGGPIEEEFVELAEGIDQTVSEQIHRLYSMEERELASGMLEKLVENLGQESPKVRRFAAQLVKETLEALDREYQLMAAGLLEDQLVTDVRAETDYAAYVPQVDSVAILARAYMQEGLADEASDIIELLKEQSGPDNEKGPELVKHAGAVLERLTGPEGMIDAQALLQEEDLEKRLVTVRALANLGPSALAPLIDMVKDRGQVDLRERALETLKASGDVGLQALLAELDKENPWYIYRNILNVIADLKLVDAVDRVAEMVNHPDERIRREAVRSLARIGAKQSVMPVMNAATNDQSPAVRRTAVRVLGMFADSSVATYLIDLMNAQGPRGREEDQAVVEAACLALGDLKDPKYVPQLVELLGKGGIFKKARPDEIRAAACIALGSIGDQAVVQALQKAARDPSMMVRSSAEKALRKLSGVVTMPEPVTPEEEREASAGGEVARVVESYRVSPHPESIESETEAAVAPAEPGEPPTGEQAPESEAHAFEAVAEGPGEEDQAPTFAEVGEPAVEESVVTEEYDIQEESLDEVDIELLEAGPPEEMEERPPAGGEPAGAGEAALEEKYAEPAVGEYVEAGPVEYEAEAPTEPAEPAAEEAGEAFSEPEMEPGPADEWTQELPASGVEPETTGYREPTAEAVQEAIEPPAEEQMPTPGAQASAEGDLEALLGGPSAAPGPDEAETVPGPGRAIEDHGEPFAAEAWEAPAAEEVPGEEAVGPPPAEAASEIEQESTGEAGFGRAITGAELEAELEPFLREAALPGAPEAEPGPPEARGEPEIGYGLEAGFPPAFDETAEPRGEARTPLPPEWLDMPVQPERQPESTGEVEAQEAPRLKAEQPPAEALEEPFVERPPEAEPPQETIAVEEPFLEAEVVEPTAAGDAGETPSEEYLPPPIPPDDTYIDNLAGEEGVFLVHDPDERTREDSYAGYDLPLAPEPVDTTAPLPEELPEPPYAARPPEPAPGQAVEMPPESRTPGESQPELTYPVEAAPYEARGPAPGWPGAHGGQETPGAAAPQVPATEPWEEFPPGPVGETSTVEGIAGGITEPDPSAEWSGEPAQPGEILPPVGPPEPPEEVPPPPVEAQYPGEPSVEAPFPGAENWPGPRIPPFEQQPQAPNAQPSLPQQERDFPAAPPPTQWQVPPPAPGWTAAPQAPPQSRPAGPQPPTQPAPPAPERRAPSAPGPAGPQGEVAPPPGMTRPVPGASAGDEKRQRRGRGAGQKKPRWWK